MTTPCKTSKFGSLLQFHRLRAGLTQQQLADFSALSVRAIRDLEHGRVERPRQDTVRLLADALRLSADSRAVFLDAARPAGPEWEAPPVTPFRAAAHLPQPAPAGYDGPAECDDPVGCDSSSGCGAPSVYGGLSGYEYATVRLGALSPDPGNGAWETALNDMAKQSWRLLAVDQGVAFLERSLPPRHHADRLSV